MSTIEYTITLLLGAGATGFISGLVGIGGGSILVPLLEHFLRVIEPTNTVAFKQATGTAFALIVLTSLSAGYSHHKKSNIDYPLLWQWLMPIAAGSIIGSLLVRVIEIRWLVLLFALQLFFTGGTMILKKHKHTERPMKGWFVLWAIPLGIGMVSALIGIAGSALMMMVFTHYHKRTHGAIGTASVLGLLVSGIAVIGYMVSGIGIEGRSAGSIGYIMPIPVLIMAPILMITAPLGVHIAHKLNQDILKKLCGVILWIIALRMLATHLI